jgi:enoyl-CoA hydratase
MAEGSRRGRPLLAIADGVAWVTLPTPAIDEDTAQRLCAAAEAIAFDESVRVAVLQSAHRDFGRAVAGGGPWQRTHDWVAAVAAVPVPVIAAVGGRAVAEGAELALACDLRIAAPAARFAFPQIGEGEFPRHGATQRLPRIVGRMRALELLVSGRSITAREALRIGLVSAVTPPAALDRTVRSAAGVLAQRAPIALRLAKEAVLAGADLTLDQGIRLEQDLYVLLQTTADRTEGVRAFLDKRRPRFHGR